VTLTAAFLPATVCWRAHAELENTARLKAVAATIMDVRKIFKRLSLSGVKTDSPEFKPI